MTIIYCEFFSSFGHHQAKQFGVNQGFKNGEPPNWTGFCLTRNSVTKVNLSDLIINLSHLRHQVGVISICVRPLGLLGAFWWNLVDVLEVYVIPVFLIDRLIEILYTEGIQLCCSFRWSMFRPHPFRPNKMLIQVRSQLPHCAGLLLNFILN